MTERLSAEDVQRRLAMLRVAKDVFVSDWYLRTADALISAQGRAVLRQVADESARERDAALALVDRWAEGYKGDELEAQGVRAMEATMARDFLDTLIHVKQASADAFQKAAAIAPRDLREKFFELANVDLVHAMALRQLLLSELPNPGDLFLGAQGQHPMRSAVAPTMAPTAGPAVTGEGAKK